MGEWQFEAAGEGALASPTQYWDIEKNTVRVGKARVAISPQDPDFELLRAARSSLGAHFPGPFCFSPDDGSPLTRPLPLVPASAESGILRIRRPAGDFLTGEIPQSIPVPAEGCVLAGDQAWGLVCDLSQGRAYRWSFAKSDWVGLPSLPLAAEFGGGRQAATMPYGFAYAANDHAVAVLWPGSAAWQKVESSTRDVVPVSKAVWCGSKAVLLGRMGEQLRLLEWASDRGWATREITGDLPDHSSAVTALVSLNGSVAGVNEDGAFLVMEDAKAIRWPWPAEFTPLPQLAPLPMGDGFFVLGFAAGSSPTWAFCSPTRNEPSMAKAEVPVMPIAGGFVGERGLSTTPLQGARAGHRLPANCVGKPLALFDDGILVLAVEAGALWASALAARRRRWRVRLVISKADGTIVDLPIEAKLDQLEHVHALVAGNALLVLGLRYQEALRWTSPEFPSLPCDRDAVPH